MSTEEDYRPCRGCGSLTDSGVCSDRCAEDLEEDKRMRRLVNGCCPDCGKPMSEAEQEREQCDKCRGDDE